MAVGVRAFSVFIPWLRRSRRAVSGWDENALTLAAEAAVPLAEQHRAAKGALSGVLFASAHARGSASLLASACDVPLERLRTTDLSGSPRAGVQAILAALDRLRAERESADALVGVADVHAAGVPGAGDAGAAVLVGRAALVAEYLGAHSVAADPDVDSAFVAVTRAAIAGALTTANVQIADVAHFAIGAPSTADALALMSAAGADAKRLAPLFDGELGHTCSAQPLLSFAAALEASKPGDLVVLAAWGDGADALVFRTTSAAARSARPLDAMIERARHVPDDAAIHVPGPSMQEAPGIRLRGAKCRSCDAIRFPASAACVVCRKEGADPIRLSRRGTVVSVESAACVVDLDGGGRLSLPFTDAGPGALVAGMPVELGVRWSSRSQYVWKARPVRA